MVLEKFAKLSVVNSAYTFESCTQRYAACPGGEDGVLKTLAPKGVVGSNPTCSVYFILIKLPSTSHWQFYSLICFL